MGSKKYSSYAEIERELEILKLEKEIHLQKLILSYERTKDALSPENMISDLFGYCKTMVASSYVKILQAVIPYIIGWLSNRKRGR
jgi:hypothetical protein